MVRQTTSVIPALGRMGKRRGAGRVGSALGRHVVRLAVLGAALVTLTSCDPQVYGSIGVSSWGGSGYGSPRVGGSITIGGRICC